MRGAAAILLVAAPLLAGCDLSMSDQPRHETEGSDTLWDGGPKAQAAPPGTVAVDAAARDEALKNPPAPTLALLERGQERYAIYCAPCHGASGKGDGAVVSRGFPAPKSFADPNLRAMPPQHVVDAVARDEALKNPPAPTLALLERGQERYAIYCAPCHGAGGKGDGAVVSRGFPAPKSFADPNLSAMPPQHVVDAISRGFGLMYDFADKIEPRDRWAIAFYVKALQRAEAEERSGR